MAQLSKAALPETECLAQTLQRYAVNHPRALSHSGRVAANLVTLREIAERALGDVLLKRLAQVLGCH